MIKRRTYLKSSRQHSLTQRPAHKRSNCQSKDWACWLDYTNICQMQTRCSDHWATRHQPIAIMVHQDRPLWSRPLLLERATLNLQLSIKLNKMLWIGRSALEACMLDHLILNHQHRRLLILQHRVVDRLASQVQRLLWNPLISSVFNRRIQDLSKQCNSSMRSVWRILVKSLRFTERLTVGSKVTYLSLTLLLFAKIWDLSLVVRPWCRCLRTSTETRMVSYTRGTS